MRKVCPICDGKDNKELFFRDFSNMKLITPFESYSVKVCQHCGMIYAGDIVTSQDLSVYYTQFSKYDTKSWIKYGFDDAYKDPLDMICKHYSSDSTVLDIGCGSGNLLRGFKNRGYTHIVGVDPSSKNCKYIHEQYGIETIAGSLGEDIPQLEGRKFRCITMTAVLEHLIPVREMVEKACSYLSPGGGIFFNVPNIETFAKLPDLYQQFSVEHVNYFSIRSLENLMNILGLKLVDFSKTDTGELNSLWKKDASVNSEISFDAEGYEAMKQYLSVSAALGNDVKRKIEHYKGKKIYIWGAGTHTAMLYQLGALEGINVKGIIDSNEHYRGVEVFGHKILHPEKDELMEYPILISSQFAQEAIKNMIRNKMRLNNSVIELY